MKICQSAAEVAPFAKTGGLGDVVAGLSRALGRRGHDVRVFLPFYSRVAKLDFPFVAVDFLKDIEVPLGDRRFTFSILTTKLPDSAVRILRQIDGMRSLEEIHELSRLEGGDFVNVWTEVYAFMHGHGYIHLSRTPMPNLQLQPSFP